VSDTHALNTGSSSNMLLKVYREVALVGRVFFMRAFRLFDELPPHERELRNICQFKMEVKIKSDLFELFRFVNP
jgi:hypothetical protein